MAALKTAPSHSPSLFWLSVLSFLIKEMQCSQAPESLKRERRSHRRHHSHGLLPTHFPYRTMWVVPPDVVHPTCWVYSWLNPMVHGILPLKPRYDGLRPEWVGGAVDCFGVMTLSRSVNGKIEGSGWGHWALGWWVARCLSQKTRGCTWANRCTG